MTKICLFCRSLIFVMLCCAVSLGAAAGNVFELVCSESTPFTAGDRIIIVAKEYNYALSTNQKVSTREAAAVTKCNGTITLGDDVQVLMLEDVGDDMFALSTGSGYLYAGKSDFLKTKTALDNYAKAGISINVGDSIATIFYPYANSRYLIFQSGTTPVFTCSTEKDKKNEICIYREKASAPEAVPAPSSNITGEAMECVNPFAVRLSLAESAAEGDRVYYSIEYEDKTAVAKTEYTVPFTMEKNGKLTYWAERGAQKSAAKVAEFTFSVAVPEISPSGGKVTALPEVSITSATIGAEIRYTLDGTEPSRESALYVAPFRPAGDSPMTVKAKAFRGNWTASAVVSVTYAIAEDLVFSKVKSLSELADGNNIIIVNEANNVALATDAGDYRNKADIMIEDETVTISEASDVQILTLEAGTTDDGIIEGFRFNTGRGYLSAKNTDGNFMPTITTRGNETLATIRFFDVGTVQIDFMAGSDYPNHSVRYTTNSSPARFTCFKETTATETIQRVQIYKLSGVKDCAKLSEAKALDNGRRFRLESELLVLKKHAERVYVYDEAADSYALVLQPDNALAEGDVISGGWSGTTRVIDGQKRLMPDAMLTKSGEKEVKPAPVEISIDNVATLTEALDARPVRLTDIGVVDAWKTDGTAPFPMYLVDTSDMDRAAGVVTKVEISARNVFGATLKSVVGRNEMVIYDTIDAFANMANNSNGETVVEVYPSELGNPSAPIAGIETIAADDAPGESYFIDLSGRRILNPTRGIYLKISGLKAEKVIVK